MLVVLLSEALPLCSHRGKLNTSVYFSFPGGCMELLDPILVGFILFCVARRGKEWPALYDEMCWVAGQRMYQGLGYSELKEKGLSLGLGSIDRTISMVNSALASRAENEEV